MTSDRHKFAGPAPSIDLLGRTMRVRYLFGEHDKEDATRLALTLLVVSPVDAEQVTVDDIMEALLTAMAFIVVDTSEGKADTAEKTADLMVALRQAVRAADGINDIEERSTH